MSVIVSSITGLFGTISSLLLKAVGFVGATVAGWFASLGIKLLSFDWIKSIVDFCKKAVSFLRKTVFNDRVVKLLKIVLSLALFALAVVQAVFIYKLFVGDVKSAVTDDYSSIVFLVINAAAVLIFTIYLAAFVFGLFKRKFHYGFAAALLFTYVISIMSYDITGLLFYRDFVNSFNALKIAFIVVFAVLAALKLIDANHKTSGFAFILSVLGALFVYLLYRGAGFANFVSYNLGREGEYAIANINFLAYIRHIKEYFAGTLDTGIVSGDKAILLQSMYLGGAKGQFVASIAVVLNGFIFVVCKIAPYLLLTAFVGFAMSMLNNRPVQVAYLSKTLRALKYLFFSVLLAFIAAHILTSIFNIGQVGEAVVLTVNTGSAVLTLLAILGLAILCAISKKLIADKYVGKYKVKK